MRISFHLIAAVLALASGVDALAQDKLAPPQDQAAGSRADQPITAQPSPPDPQLPLLMQWLSGTFESASTPDQPALRMHTGPASIAKLPDTIMVELARADSPADPFRIYFLHLYRRQGELRLRTLDLPSTPAIKDAIAGLWAAPDLLPGMELASLIPSIDLPLTLDRAGFNGSTAQPVPTTRQGAVEMTASITISPTSIICADAGFDAEGVRIWGQPKGKFIEFARVTSEPPTVRREDGGLVIITTIPPTPDAPKLQPGGEVVFHYSTWTSTGQFIESSRSPSKEPAKTRVPGSIIQGLNIGLTGIAKGERRRIVIPPALAYADRGKGVVPPNSTIIFDVECLRVDNSPPTTPPAPQPPATNTANPHAPKSPSDQPIGTPPTNGAPETPRK